jgi:hypothetical protein
MLHASASVSLFAPPPSLSSHNKIHDEHLSVKVFVYSNILLVHFCVWSN